MLAALPFPVVRPVRPLAPQVRGPRPTTPPALLLVGHGTRCLPGEQQFQAFVARVTARLARRGVDATGGLIELAPPPVTDAASDLVARGHHDVIAVPLMLVAAGHAKGDIPAALDRETQRFPGLRYRYAAVLGPDPLVLAALTERLADALPAHERAGAYVVLVGRGSTDPDANSEVARAARLLFEDATRRGAPLGGVEPAFVSLADPGIPAALERCRLLGAKRVVVLPLFMFTGVLPRRIVSQAEQWAAQHRELTVSCADVIGDCDLLAEAVEQRYLEAVAGPVRAGCDTCMYRVALPGFEDRVGRPQTPHDHPDDPVSHSHSHSHSPAADLPRR